MRKRIKLQNLDKCRDLGFILQDKDYLGRTVKHKFLCLTHKEIHSCTANQILVGKGLSCCGPSKFRASRQLDFSKMKSELLERGFKVLDKEYHGIKSKYQIMCLTHQKTSFAKLENMIYRKDRLICCKIASRSGVNSPWYDKSLSDADRAKNRDRRAKHWRDAVYKRDGYTCLCCKATGGELNAHHIFNWRDNLELRYQLGNGATMCKNCHTEFHSRYGSRNTTDVQLNNFIQAKQADKKGK